jgi:hypothetical protein
VNSIGLLIVASCSDSARYELCGSLASRTSSGPFRTVAHPVRAFNGALRWANEWESWGLRLLAEDLANVHADQYATKYRR